jgi:hypothetical protein
MRAQKLRKQPTLTASDDDMDLLNDGKALLNKDRSSPPIGDGNKSLYLVFVGVVFSQHLGLLLEQLGQHLELLLEQLGQQHLDCFVRTAGQQHLDCF